MPREHHNNETKQSSVSYKTKLPSCTQTQAYSRTNHKRENSEALRNNNWRQKKSTDDGVQSISRLKDSRSFAFRSELNTAENSDQVQSAIINAIPRANIPYHTSESSEKKCDESNTTRSKVVTDTRFNKARSDSSDDGNGENFNPNLLHGPSMNRSEEIKLGPKHFYKMSNLQCPTTGTHNSYDLSDFCTLSSLDYSGESSGSFGFVTISENSSELHSDSCSSEELTHTEPTVQLQQVKRRHNLKPTSWSHVGCMIRSNSSVKGQITESITLPIYPDDQFQEQLSKSPLYFQSKIQNFTCEDEADRPDKPIEPSIDVDAHFPAEVERYQRVLAKLNKSSSKQSSQGEETCDHTNFTPSPGKQANVPQICGSDTEQWKYEPTSQVTFNDNLSAKSFQKARTLNPKAAEFSISSDPTKKASTIQFGSPNKFTRPSIHEFFIGETAAIPPATMIPPPVRHALQPPAVNNSITGLVTHEELMVAAKVLEYLRRGGQLHGLDQIAAGAQAGVNVRYDQGFHRQHMPIPRTQNMIPYGTMNSSNPAQPLGQHGSFADTNPHISMPGGFYPGQERIPSSMLRPALPTTNNLDVNRPTMDTQSFQSSQGARGVFLAPAHSNLSSVPSGTNTSAPAWAGPIPVCKPKGPPRPNDPVWCQQQIKYEAYLEWKRSIDHDFHREGRERQANRAEKKNKAEL